MKQRQLIIGVTGGIAAYKTAALVSQLAQQGAQVRVVMTRSAERFVGPATFAALTGHPVYGDTFDERRCPLGAHIDLAEWGELLCVAPATANFLAKAAHGIADDLLSTLYLSCTRPVLVAPAMKCDMWEKAAVQRNVEQLQRDGVQLVGPEEGWLSCRQRGVGRMAEPETIFQAIAKHLCLES
jgi:phosphopantothenoylcysteine decarboxylase/phosphopantothenate--cysteine ligase